MASAPSFPASCLLFCQTLWWPSYLAVRPSQSIQRYAAYAGRIFVFGGMTGSRLRLASVEALDLRVGRWERMPGMALPRSSCGAAALHDQLYVAGGSGGDDRIHESVECYVPAAGKWMPVAPIGHARTGLSLAAI